MNGEPLGWEQGEDELFTATTEAISVLLSSTGQAVGCHSPFSCDSSRATTSGRKGDSRGGPPSFVEK